MAVATCGSSGHPSVRYVLLKGEHYRHKPGQHADKAVKQVVFSVGASTCWCMWWMGVPRGALYSLHVLMFDCWNCFVVLNLCEVA